MTNLGNLISKYDVKQWFERKEVKEGKINLKILHEGAEILSGTGIEEFEVKVKQNKETIHQALFISGLYDLRLSITSKNGTHNIATNENKFEKRFFSSIGNGILVPDTNFLIDHTLCALKSIINQQDLFKKIRVMIPRLAILELEDISNREKNVKRRKAMYGFTEVANLRADGAELLGLKLDKDTQGGFSKFASEKRTDSWIRREIHDLKDRKVRFGYEDDVIFCTSDQISSLSAIAENIDTMNATKHENYRQSPRRANIDQLAKLVVTLSIFFKKITIEINKDKGVMTGIWEGKTNTDWIKNKVFYKSKRST